MARWLNMIEINFPDASAEKEFLDFDCLWNYNEKYYRDIIIITRSKHILLHQYIVYDQTIFMFRWKLEPRKPFRLEKRIRKNNFSASS